MTDFPAVTGLQIVKALMKAGFHKVSQVGSHVKMAHADGRISVIPVHRAEIIGAGLFGKILKDVKMGREEFRELLHK